jgi:methionyl-tRNA synthetase
MIQRYLGGAVVEPGAATQGDWANLANDTIGRVKHCFASFEFSRGLEAVWALLGAVDKYIVEQKPWELAKNDTPEARQSLATTLYNSAEVLRIAAALIYPVMPKVATDIWRLLGQTTPIEQTRLEQLKWGQLEPGTRVGAAAALFPRLDVGESIEKLAQLEEIVLKEQAEIMGKEEAKEPPAVEAAEPPVQAPKIGIEDFAKVEMRVGQVKSAAKVKKADRLLHLTVDIGEPEPRSIVAGIAEAYTPESLVGRKVVIVANLEPRKLRGIESDGMVVAATNADGKPCLVGFHEDAPVGAALE